MRVLGLALAGVLALTVPITGYAGGPGGGGSWYRVGTGRRGFEQALGDCRRPSNGRSRSPME